jgi:phosphotransferase system HPr-like phosphotransfer protein
LIRGFHARASEILTASVKSFTEAMNALSTAHAETLADLGALGANTEAEINNRLETSEQKREEWLAHFRGEVPLKEPTIRITAPPPTAPQPGDESWLGATPGYANGEAATADAGSGQ